MKKKFIPYVVQNTEKILWGVIFLAIFIGGIYSLYLGDLFRFYDESEYYLIAQNIVKKGFITINGSDPSAWRPPGYPVWLSMFMTIGFNIFLLRLVNFVLLGASMFLVFKILETKSKLIALCGVGLVLFYPVFFFTASTLYPQTFVTTLFLLTIYMLFKESIISYRTAIFVGAIFGVLVLTVVTFIGSLFVTALWLVYSSKEQWKKAAVMILTTLLVLTPWTVRNYLVFDSFVFIANNGGVAFVLGNSPDTKPNLGGNISLPKFDKTKLKSEVDIDRYYKSIAIEYMLNNKLKTVKMYFLKLLNHFNYSNVLMTRSQMSVVRDTVLFVTFYTLCGFALMRIAMFKKISLSSKDLYLILLYLCHGMMLALFITRIRYRLPYDSILALLGAPAFGYSLLKITRRNSNHTK